MSHGLLSSKPPEIVKDNVWLYAFYLHIGFGGIALLMGFSQFSVRLRKWRVGLHRNLGKIYLIAVSLSGLSGLYIALFATGGIIPILGFTGLALGWLFTTIRAYSEIRKRDFIEHEYFMIRSYALCWAAVTLRIWLPLFQFALGMDFILAYSIIAWLCWVPNLVVAEIIIRRKKARSLRFAL